MKITHKKSNLMSSSLMMTALIIGGLSLTACDKTKEQLNLSKKAPDEFAVVKRAPLEMPPTYALRPPTPGAARPQELNTDQQAREAILGTQEIKAAARQSGVSQGEAVLLQKTGALSVDPNIRTVVDQESSELGEKDMPGIDKLKQMAGQKIDPPAKVVDPVAEAARIKQDKAAGKPITAGKTPSIEE